MLVRRCAWHRIYRGYPFLYGVASWRGEGFDFTDGLCHGCAGRARAEMAGLEFTPVATAPRRAVAVAAALMFLLAPEVLDQFPAGVFNLPAVLRPVALVPQALTVREASADEPSSPAVDIAAVLALVTAAASAVDGPVATAPPASEQPTRRRPDRVWPPSALPTRAQVRFYDDPLSPLAAYAIQAP